jgi:hypothetical protein
VCAGAGFTVVAFNAVEAIIYNCKPPVDPYFPEWCGPSNTTLLSILIGPWLVATFLLARREAIVLFGSGFTYGWFACVFMGLMWWLGFLAFVVLWLYEAGSGAPHANAECYCDRWRSDPPGHRSLLPKVSSSAPRPPGEGPRPQSTRYRPRTRERDNPV